MSREGGMTEEEWLATADPQALLAHLRSAGTATDRKYRLFACACCRRIWVEFSDDRARALVTAMEDAPDGPPHDPTARAAVAPEEFYGSPTAGLVSFLLQGFHQWSGSKVASKVSADVLFRVHPEPGREFESVQFWLGFGVDSSASRSARLRFPLPPEVEAEAAAQAALVRDVFGNACSPAQFDPAWRTENVALLAKGMYESRDFSAMPILADALEEVGCENEDVLQHCRGSGPHVRGCWVVDLVLGKA